MPSHDCDKAEQATWRQVAELCEDADDILMMIDEIAERAENRALEGAVKRLRESLGRLVMLA